MHVIIEEIDHYSFCKFTRLASDGKRTWFSDPHGSTPFVACMNQLDLTFSCYLQIPMWLSQSFVPYNIDIMLCIIIYILFGYSR